LSFDGKSCLGRNFDKSLVKNRAIGYNQLTVLGGELVVPCHPQTTTAGPNAVGGFRVESVDEARGVDIKVLCNGEP